MSKFTKIVIVMLALIVLLALLVGFSLSKLNANEVISANYKDDDRYLTADKEVDITKSVRKIEVNWVVGKVRIEEYDGDSIYFTENYKGEIKDEYKARYYLSGDKVKINYAKATNYKNPPEKDLTIYIPSSITLNEIEIECISDEIDITLTNLNSLSIENVSSLVNVVVDSIDEIDYETVSGDLYLSVREKLNEMDFSSVNASAYLSINPNSSFIAEIEGIGTELESSFEGTLKGEKFIVNGGKSEYSFSSVNGKLVINEL